MDTPFAMSFEEVKAQADANMKADKGQAAPAQQQNTAKAPGAGKSFLDMVEEAERTLAQDDKTGSQAVTQQTEAAPVQQTDAQATTGMQGSLTFDDMFAQAQGAPQAQATPQSGALTFDDMFAQAQQGQSGPQLHGASQGQTAATPSNDPAQQAQPQMNPTAALTFDDIFAQAQNQTAPAQNQAAQTASEQAASDQTTSSGALTFDEILAQAQAKTNPTPKTEESQAEKPKTEEPKDAPKTEEPKMEEPKDAPQTEEPKIEESRDAPQAEETKTEESQAEKPNDTPQAEEPKTEEPQAEASLAKEPVKEEPKAEETKTRRGKRSSKKKEEDVEKEPLPDVTQDYKVDVLGEDKAEETQEEKPVSAGAGSDLSLTTLFTQEEIAALRTSVHVFVRRELKKALVGAMTDLLAEFSE